MTDKKITLIAACSINGVIGNGNEIPWKLPADMKHFKDTTMGHVVVMGRKTFESMGGKPLKGRTNIILSRTNTPGETTDDETKTYSFKVTQLNHAIAMAKGLQSADQTTFIIGGEHVYRQTIDMADELIISHVNILVEGDAYFPLEKLRDFSITSYETHADDHGSFTITRYTRK